MRHKMKVMLVLVAAGAVTNASAQQSAAPATAERRVIVEREMQASIATGGTARMAVEAKIVTGAPYSADATTEFNQVLSDGNRITRRSVTRTYRDSEGRTRREQVRSDGAGADTVRITITDPVGRMTAVLDPQKREATRLGGVYSVAIARPVPTPEGGAGGLGGAVARRSYEADLEERRRIEAAVGTYTRQPAPEDENTTTESLGQQMMDGILAEGKRTTRVIPAGAVGNLQPIKIVSEEWFSPDLQVLVMTRHSDPRTGETVYRLTNIVRAEQDRSLFDIPPDYTIKEQRRR